MEKISMTSKYEIIFKRKINTQPISPNAEKIDKENSNSTLQRFLSAKL